MFEQEVRATDGSPPEGLDANQLALVRAEVRRRVHRLAHRMLLPDQHRDHLAEMVFRRLRDLDLLEKIASAASPQFRLIQILKDEADRLTTHPRESADQRRSPFEAISPGEYELLRERFLWGQSVGQIATAAGRSFSDVAAELFHIIQKLIDAVEKDSNPTQ